MDYSILYLDPGSILPEERLNVEGSNYVDWFYRLREILRTYNLVYVIEGLLGEAPDADASVRELEDHVIRLNHTMAVKNLMYESVAPYWQNIFQNHVPWDMIGDLVSRFAPQARVSKFECIDEFHSKKLEEGASVEEHLTTMTRLYRRLADVFDYQIDDEMAIDVLMISLPPSYHGFVENYVKGNVELS